MSKKNKGTSLKKMTKRLRKNRKFLVAEVKLAQKEIHFQYEQLKIAHHTLEVLDATNPAKIALQQMDKLFNDFWETR